MATGYDVSTSIVRFLVRAFEFGPVQRLYEDRTAIVQRSRDGPVVSSASSQIVRYRTEIVRYRTEIVRYRAGAAQRLCIAIVSF